MSSLLSALRDEAVQLVESDLPSSEELRPLVGALVTRLERLETHVLGEVAPAPTPEPVHEPTEEELAERELAAAQAKLDAVKAKSQGDNPPAPTVVG